MRRLLPLLWALCLLPALASAAPKDLDQFMLRARVYELTDMKYGQVDSVSLTLVKDDSITVPFKLLTAIPGTDMNKGADIRMMVQSGLGNYQLHLYKEGYQPCTKTFKISSVSQDLINLYAINMKREVELHRELDEVTVQATRVKMVMKGDTIVYDASAFQLSEGSMLDELVRQLPNATLDEDGVITVNGRKINELLLNGKDFFKGDPNIALKNLPGYTVKNIKVYDKAADNAYLTHSDARISDNQDDENLVMDVNLKKEYMTGWMANVGLSYGVEDLYKARGFGMGYTDRLRIAAFINTNNLADHSTNENGYGGGNASTFETVITGGANYTYEHDRWKASGSASATRTHNNNESLSSSTRFFNTRDLYDRSSGTSSSRNRNFNTNHNVFFKGDIFSIEVKPSFSYGKGDSHSISRKATLDSRPDESYMGECLDSLFGDAGRSTAYFANLLTDMLTLGNNDSHNLSGNLSANFTFRPRTWKGYLTAFVTGSYSENASDNLQLLAQTIGPKADKPDATPISRIQTNPRNTYGRNLNGGVTYKQDIRKFGESSTRTLGYGISLSGTLTHNNNGNNLWTDTIPDDMELRLPSLYRPENMIHDLINSVYQTTDTKQGVANGSISYSMEPTAPGDSTFNAGFNTSLTLIGRLTNEGIIYAKPEATPFDISRTSVVPQLSFNIGMHSRNRLRQIMLRFGYNAGITKPALSYFIPYTVSSNPTDITVAAQQGDLRNSVAHGMNLAFNRFSLGPHQNRFTLHLNWNISTDAYGMAVVYNPSTGVSTRTPRNINGNWIGRVNTNYSLNVGPENKFELSGQLGFTYTNSADYMTIETEPVRSSVRTAELYPRISTTYRISGGSTVSLRVGTNWVDSESDRQGFRPINAWNHSGAVNANLVLPWSIRLNTSLNATMRRGYDDKEMNTTEWLWNASIERTFINNTLTLRIDGVDLLDSRNPVSRSVNAQGITETWRKTLRRYALFTVVYRFDRKPKKGSAAEENIPGQRRPGSGRGSGQGRGMGGGRGMH